MNYFGQHAYDILDIIIAILALGVVIRGDMRRTLIEIRNRIDTVSSGLFYRKHSPYSNHYPPNGKTNDDDTITLNELYAVDSAAKDHKSQVRASNEGLFSQTLAIRAFSFALVLCVLALLFRSGKFLLILSLAAMLVFPLLLIYMSKYASKHY